MSQPRRRVYGSDHDDPYPYARPGHTYRELVGDPLDVTGSSEEELAEGAALITEIGQFGPGGRALYGPRPTNPSLWDWEGDCP
ncbi:hypothetical protein FM076_32995 [Streptomyces albus subsp. chlorinus]|uniref:hypothetical protein n=1 Tax=Streptomyces albus TaxID=1888 RepID=UPI00156E92C8|nr:hypothetical protein [Streptomyces albus]NSC25705.1 hypothetical protein [Streptomyces albus subsp. chlorinus]